MQGEEITSQKVHNGSWIHTASYSMPKGVPSSGGKWLGREANHSSLSSAEIKNEWSHNSTDTHAFKTSTGTLIL
jgi:hypothetical protein